MWKHFAERPEKQKELSSSAKWKIKRETLEAVLLAAQNTFPNEFFCLLGGNGKKQIIEEFVVIPAVFGKTHTLVQDWMKPIDKGIVGSVHSHPSHGGFPSGADLRSFPRFGEVHLVLAYPFSMQDARLFDLRGKQIKFELY